MKLKTSALAALAALILVGWSIIPAHAEEHNSQAKGCDLTCHEAAGWGFIIGSSRQIRCTYSSNAGRTEYYTGSISKFGADIGYLSSAVILWAVAAPSKDINAGALAGSYAGASASLTLGAGAGANVLRAAVKNSSSLHPASIARHHGIQVAAGSSAMKRPYY